MQAVKEMPKGTCHGEKRRGESVGDRKMRGQKKPDLGEARIKGKSTQVRKLVRMKSCREII